MMILGKSSTPSQHRRIAIPLKRRHQALRPLCPYALRCRRPCQREFVLSTHMCRIPHSLITHRSGLMPHPSCRRTSNKPGLRRGALAPAPLCWSPLAWEVAPLRTLTPLLFFATGPTLPFDGRGFQAPLHLEDSMRFTSSRVFSLLFYSFCEFCLFRAPSSRLNHGALQVLFSATPIY